MEKHDPLLDPALVHKLDPGDFEDYSPPKHQATLELTLGEEGTSRKPMDDIARAIERIKTIDQLDKAPPMLPTTAFEAKFLLSGMPKCGLHLLDLLVRPLVRPMPEDPKWQSPWSGNFDHNSWSQEMIPLERVGFRLGRVQSGRFLKAHMGYVPELALFMYYLGLIHIMIYRDLRDVAVSQTYHIMSEDDGRFAHDGKDAYRALGGFDEILEAVIAGLDIYPGVLERWSFYQPWFEHDWTLCISFEEIKQDRKKAGIKIINYMMKRLAIVYAATEARVEPEAVDKLSDAMVLTSKQVHLSPTFRKGKSGGWKTHFTDRHKRIFKELDRETNYLVRLGYEKDQEW